MSIRNSALMGITVLALSSTSPALAAPQPAVIERLACIGQAVDIRGQALTSAYAAYSQSMNDAYAAQTAALHQAYTFTTDAEVNAAVKVANTAFSASTDAAGDAWRSARQSAEHTFRASQKICNQSSIVSPSLTAQVDLGATPATSIAIAGSSNVKIGSFRFIAKRSAYTINDLLVKVPSDAANSIASITLKYRDRSGVIQTVSQGLVLQTGVYATATFTGLTLYIPQDRTANMDVLVNLPSIADGATSGAPVSVVLDGNAGFRAFDNAGNALTTLSASDLSSSARAGYGTIVIRKTLPTLSAVALGSSALVAGPDKPIARVRVTANPSGDVSFSSIAFTLNVSGADLSSYTLWSGTTKISGSVVATPKGILFPLVPEQVISAGTSKTYELRATIGSIASGPATVRVSIGHPSTAVVTGSVADISQNETSPSFVWSDNSSFSVHSPASADWTNDYLVRALPLMVGTLASK